MAVKQITRKVLQDVGHPIDWETLVHRDGPKLYRYFCARFSHSEASDLVQEVLLRIFCKRETDGYDAAQGSFAAYALGIAHFVAREAVRKTSRRREEFLQSDTRWLNLESAGNSPEEHALQQEAVENLRTAIRCLPQTEQEVLALLVERDLSLQDIAKILEMPLGTVKSHIYRAKTKLKEALDRAP
jgi:RNA polymerase sigma-70 factor (ECF subfamily)